MTAPVLTKEQVQARIDRYNAGELEDPRLCASHEALRADRDAIRESLNDAVQLLAKVTAERDALAAKLEAVIAPVEAGGGIAAHYKAERDSLAAKVAELEGKASAYDDTHRGDFESRARALAQAVPASWGRNIWHLVVELAEQRGAKVAVLNGALSDAWSAIKHARQRADEAGALND